MPVNSHYVPQFILREYGKQITCFNWKTGELKAGRNPKTVFSDMGFYPDDLEKEMNEKCEVRFSPTLRKLLSSKKDIQLTRLSVWEIKRFLLITMLRSKGMLEQIAHERKVTREELTDHPMQVVRELGWRISETESNESDYDYWIRSIRSVLDEPTGSPLRLEDSRDATSTAVIWSRTFNAGYLAFWDAPEGESFFIGDSGIYRESELKEMVLGEPSMKLDMLNRLLEDTDDTDAERIYALKRMIRFNSYFWDNFLLFPVSSRRIIVLVNPFFKCMHEELRRILYDHESVPDTGKVRSDIFELIIRRITNLYRAELTLPNTNEYQDTCYTEQDGFTHSPKVLLPEELHYINVLIMSQTQEWLGFSKAEEILPSLRFCRERVGKLVEDDPYLKLLELLDKQSQ